MIRKGNLRGEKIEYSDGVGCSVWYPFPASEDVGLCFDFPVEDIDDLIALLQALKKAQAEKEKVTK